MAQYTFIPINLSTNKLWNDAGTVYLRKLPNETDQQALIRKNNNSSTVVLINIPGTVISNGNITTVGPPLVPVPVSPSPVTPVNYTTTIVKANSNVFNPQVQWNNGKARVVDLVNTTETKWYFYGTDAVNNLPTDYTLEPGDTVAIYKVIASSPNPNVFSWNSNIKGYAQISIGSPNT